MVMLMSGKESVGTLYRLTTQAEALSIAPFFFKTHAYASNTSRALVGRNASLPIDFHVDGIVPGTAE